MIRALQVESLVEQVEPHRQLVATIAFLERNLELQSTARIHLRVLLVLPVVLQGKLVHPIFLAFTIYLPS